MRGNDLEAVLRIKGDTREARSELDRLGGKIREIDGTIASKKGAFADMFGPLAARLGTAALVTSLGLVASQSIRAASAVEELRSAAQVTFLQTFPQVEARAQAIAQEVGRAGSTILGFATDMGAILTPTRLSTEAVGEMSLELSKLAVDLASFRNTSDEQAFMALRSGIVGETEPLRRYGVVLLQTTLQEYAHRNGIRQKLETMNQAQLATLRYNFILEQTKLAQGDAARTAGSFANQARRLKDEWKSTLEVLGKSFAPVAAKGLGVLSGALRTFRQDAIDAARAMQVISTFAMTGSVDKANQQGRFRPLSDTAGPTIPEGRLGEIAAAQQNSALKKQIEDLAKLGSVGGGGGGGGGKDAAKEQEEILNKIEAIERDIVQALSEQARMNADRLRDHRDELKLKKELGTLTQREARELDRVNGRLQFADENVRDVTEAWREQLSALKEADRRIEDINEKLAEQNARYADTLADINRKAARSRVDAVADMIKELDELDQKLARGEGNSQRDQDRRREIEAMLRQASPEELASGKAAAGRDAFGEIAARAEQERQDAMRENDERTLALQAEMDAAQVNRDQVARLEQEKRDAVIQALSERRLATETELTLIEQRTTQHVNQQIAEYDRLRSKMKGVTPASASGGQTIGGGNTVTVGPIYVSKEVDANKVIDQVTRSLQLQGFQSN